MLSSQNGITLRHNPGPTKGSIWVEVLDNHILFTGDSIANDTQPYLKEMEWKDWMDSLELLKDRQEQIDLLVPGRGEVSDFSVVTSMMGYLERMKTLILNHINEGRARDELKNQAYQLLTEFPVEKSLEEWSLCQVIRGLERVYDQVVSSKFPGDNGKDHPT
jgi:glyoxylase-like metal-dependent hydrolase (beta-lactamase superfamily II)